MNIIAMMLLFIGICVYNIGFYYFSVSNGESECSIIPTSHDANYGGGIAGMVIGAIIILAGVIYMAYF